MASATYSFLDVAALDGVRQRFASGDALAILSGDLDEVIWANGPGAALLGYDDIESAIGARARLGMAAKRQIQATRGFPKIGKDRPVQVRMSTGLSSRMEAFLASAVTLPDGEAAIMLASPAATGGARSAADIARRAISGFAGAGHFVAFLDAAGSIEAATAGFDKLGLAPDTLAAMAEKAAGAGSHTAKQMIEGRNGMLPAGLARLTEQRNLLVVVDENAAGPADGWPEAAAEPQATEAPEQPAAAEAPGADESGEGQSRTAAGPEQTSAGPKDGAAEVPSPAEHESWYFSEDAADESASGGQVPGENADQPTTASEEQTAEDVKPDLGQAPQEEKAPPVPGDRPAEPSRARSEADASAAPVRFVWRTDAEGKFSHISPEFLAAIGVDEAAIVGRSFEAVAEAFGLDPKGEIAGLLSRRDTWSGRSVLWPVAGTDLHVPVDLAALPVYDRARVFEGFRGFGVARSGDASVDAKAPGLKPEKPEAEKRDEADAKSEDAPADDLFKGEVPALKVVPAHNRRSTDKVISLAEHRAPPAVDKGLTSGERIAFQQIGERLKKDGLTGPAAEATRAVKPGDEAGTPRDDIPASAATSQTPASAGTVADKDPTAEPSGDEARDIEMLERLDGVGDAGTTEGDASPAPEPAEGEAPAAETRAQGADGAAEAAGEAVTPDAADKPAARQGRPGMSLLDFAQWDDAGGAAPEAGEPAGAKDAEEAAEAKDAGDAGPTAAASEDGEQPGARPTPEVPGTAVEDEGPAEPVDRKAAGWRRFKLVEMEEAASLDERTPDAARGDAPAPGEAVPDVAAYEEESAPASAGQDAAKPAPGEAPPLKPAASLSILEKLPVPVLVHSGDMLHYANDEFAALTGYATVEELAEAGGIGALFADSYEEEDAAEKTDRQLRLKTKGGEEIPVDAFLQSVPWNGGKALLLVLSPVKDGAFGTSGQSPLIAELEARVAEMRTIIDTATDGVVLISQDGTIRSISHPAEALFGFESDEVAGQPFTTLFAIESQRAARDYLAGLSENGVASVLNDGREVIGREAQGRFIPLFMTIGKLPNDSGYCAVVRDITQWKRAEEELTQARAVAERASSQKTDFLARVSHEIRTPLNAIIGFSELMMDEKFGPVANERYRDYLRDINRSGNHVLDLVNDLLDISKIEAGQQEMDYEAVSLNDALGEAVAMMQPQANRERVIIRSSFASKLPDVVADLRSVRQIALNILSNAVRYTQAGGQVIVSTAYEAAGDVVMRVRDTGIGMTQPEIEQALKPFKQINSLKRARGDGTGLGLPLTKAMVEANRAKFTINSTPGEGTLVEISFPSTRVLAD